MGLGHHFSVYKQAGQACYVVKFKDAAGKYLPAISTKQKTEAAAIETAFKWLREGIPQKSGAVTPEAYKMRDAIRKTDFTKADAELLVEELKRRGLIVKAVFPESREAVDFGAFLTDFWTWETSPYIAEKLRKQHGIHKYYVKSQLLTAQKYWIPFFMGRVLGSLTKADIEAFIKTMDEKPLSPEWKNHVIKAGTIALKWAYSKELIERDITAGIVWYAGKAKERQILTPELVKALFRVKWTDGRAKLANMLAMATGMRAGEIQGLRVQDLGQDCLNIRHSWNGRDGLKPTKNNESRRVELPFPEMITALLEQAGRNPHGCGMDSYIFWADKKADKPMEQRLFLDCLREALGKIGLTGKDYCFHAWRHYFTAYMRDKVNEKLLQRQTGHKTLIMLDHYSDHSKAGEREQIQQAQRATFGALLPLNGGAAEYKQIGA